MEKERKYKIDNPLIKEPRGEEVFDIMYELDLRIKDLEIQLKDLKDITIILNNDIEMLNIKRVIAVLLKADIIQRR